MVSSGLLWWREKGLTLHGEASTLHHELHLMLFNCVITWEILGVLLGKRQALQSVPQMFQGNNQKMKFIWLLKPLWQLPFHFSNLLCLSPSSASCASWDICLKAEPGISLFTLFQSNQLHQTKSFGISQWICPLCPAIHHSPASTADITLGCCRKYHQRKSGFKETDLPHFQCTMPAPICNSAMSPDQPYKVGMQQNPSFLFPQALPSTNLMSVNVQEGKEGMNVVKPTPAPISIKTCRIIMQLQDTGWEIQGESPGVSCGSMVIPGCCSKATAGMWLHLGSKACGNCSCHLSQSIFQQPTWMGVHKPTENGAWKVLFLPENPSPCELENGQMAAGWESCFVQPG